MNSSTHKLAYTFSEAVFKIDYVITREKWEEALRLLMERDTPLNHALSTSSGEQFRELRIAYCLVRLEQYTKANKYLQSILKTDPDDAYAKALMGFTKLVVDEKEDAIFYFSGLLEKKQFQKRGKKVLNEIKKSKSLIALAMNKPFSFFYPEHRISLWEQILFFCTKLVNSLLKVTKEKKVFTTVLLTAVIFSAIIFTFSPYKEQLYRKVVNLLFPLATPLSPPNLSEQQQKLWNSMGKQPVDDAVYNTGVVSFSKIYGNLKTAIAKGKVNEATMLYNEAMAYDAPIPIKEQFEILASFIPKPNFSSFENSGNLSVLSSSPTIYKNTYWKYVGKASSVVQKNQSLRMQLLVFAGSNLRNVLDLQFDEIIIVPEPGKNYEVLMQFRGKSVDGNILMRGVGIKLLK